MTITRLETKQRMSRIVIHNDTVYLCGQVAEDASKGIKEQTETMLAKVDDLLEVTGRMSFQPQYISNLWLFLLK